MMTAFTAKDKRVSAGMILRYIVLLGVVLSMAACGIKPGKLTTPPSGKDAPAYPGVYPNPKNID